MEEIRKLVTEHYGLTALGCRESGSRTEVYTDRGLYYLYSCPAVYRYKRKFIEKVQRQVLRHGGNGLLPLVKTVKGQSYIVDGNELYFLHAGVREAKTAEQAYATGQALARFHQSTGSFTGERLFLPYRSLGGWPAMWRKKLRQYSAYRDELENERGIITPFDEYLLTTYTYIHHLGDTAVQYLLDAGYNRVIKETAGYGKVAYQNFDDGYIMIADDGSRYIAAEWCWVIDMRARDIGQWIKAEIRRAGWNHDRISQFLDGYNSVSKLLPEEYACIYALLLYPGRFLKLVEAYRAFPVDDLESLDFSDWREMLEEELQYMEMALRDYPRLITARYGAVIPQIDWLWGSADEETLCVHDKAGSG
jgi:spore coat protein YutH